MIMDRVTRVHYEIPDDLHRRLKIIAAKRDLTLRKTVIQALEQYADTVEAEEQRKREGRP
ncbi:MAG TPA: hypothetical protein VIV12_09920 [Streptosporangiaceae bacterium]